MGDRFYMQRNVHEGLPADTKNPPIKKIKRLKANIVKDINAMLPKAINGLDKLTHADLLELERNIKILIQ